MTAENMGAEVMTDTARSNRSPHHIVRPIILVGTGRCGSTLLHRILSYHPNLAWLTPLTHLLPRRPWVTRWATPAVDTAAGDLLRRWIRPSEAYPFWNHYCPGFGPTSRDLEAGDLGAECADGVRNALERLLTPRRSRLLLKITGWPRVGFLRALFDDALFVHIRRDGRAVAHSWLGVDWWPGREGPSDWSWGPLSVDQTRRWEASGRSSVSLAAIAWEILMDAHARALDPLSAGTALELTYEELCSKPVEVVRRVADFCDLPWTAPFEQRVASIEVRNTNEAWRRRLSEAERRVLETAIRPALARHGYT